MLHISYIFLHNFHAPGHPLRNLHRHLGASLPIEKLADMKPDGFSSVMIIRITYIDAARNKKYVWLYYISPKYSLVWYGLFHIPLVLLVFPMHCIGEF
jgi:hypothetical protein